MSEKSKYLPVITVFLSDEYSVCREERQYALFLYNYICGLKKYGDPYELKKQLFGDSEIEIKHVFYEATFMRDFFERDRRLTYLNGAAGDAKEKEQEKICQKNSPVSTRPNVNDSRFNVLLFQYMEEVMRNLLMQENGSKKTDEQETIVKDGTTVRFNLKKWKPVKAPKNSKKTTQEMKIPEIKINPFINQENSKNLDYIVDYHVGYSGGQQKLPRFISVEADKMEADKAEIDVEAIKTLARALMNSKPDIAVVYTKTGDDTTYLQFFECKFESVIGETGEKKNPDFHEENDNSIKSSGTISQIEAQDLIAYFLTEFLSKNKVNKEEKRYYVADRFEKTKLVNFYRVNDDNTDQDKNRVITSNDSNKESKDTSVDIAIKDMIEYHKKMFELDETK